MFLYVLVYSKSNAFFRLFSFDVFGGIVINGPDLPVTISSAYTLF